MIKPNHHYAVHTSEFIHDFGPVYGFWTFLFECLNKVLKSYKSNNHGLGHLEASFFCEFHHIIHVSQIVSSDHSVALLDFHWITSLSLEKLLGLWTQLGGQQHHSWWIQVVMTMVLYKLWHANSMMPKWMVSFSIWIRRNQQLMWSQMGRWSTYHNHCIRSCT